MYSLGLYELLKSIKAEWDKPILITENGIAINLITCGLHSLFPSERGKESTKRGAYVIRYLHWSLVDNYEWVESYRQEGKFGLFYINHKGDKNLVRKITKGVQALKIIIEESLSESRQGLVTDGAFQTAENKYSSLTSEGISDTE